MTAEKTKPTDVKAEGPKTDAKEAQAYIRPPTQGGKKEYTLPNGTKVKHN